MLMLGNGHDIFGATIMRMRCLKSKSILCWAKINLHSSIKYDVAGTSLCLDFQI